MGNSHPGRRTREASAPPEQYRTEQQPPSPGSPLTYATQIAMEPMQRVQDNHKSAADIPFTCPAQPKLVPTAITWSHGGNLVEVEGSFDNWMTRYPLIKTGNDFTIVKLLPPGVYQFKFIVDGEWQYDPKQEAMYDEMNNVNNVIEVQEYAPENLDNLTDFDLPPSPDSSYCKPEVSAEDFQKEPPSMPAHLNLSLLNVPPALDAQAVLPRPLHVILNHSYVQRETEGECSTVALGATTRYKSKYITTVFYKAQGPASVPVSSDTLDGVMSF